MTALDERIAKARAGSLQVVARTATRFAVTNGEGGAYEADFSAANTGVCDCPDFASRGRYLHACKHTAAVVLSQWPAAWDRWESKVRALARASIAQLPAEAQAESTPAAAAPAITNAQLVSTVVQAALPLVLARVLAALAEAAPELTRQVLVDLDFAARPGAAQSGLAGGQVGHGAPAQH
jgi:uncharacterized Zn finger protein